MLKSFRYLLFPFSLLYGLVILCRNWLFDRQYLKSAEFNFPIICVGNLAVGGTGKTPMVEFLVRMLKSDFRVATLSRGYKRKTQGFGIANEFTTALEIGDEPMQFHLKFPDITVAVGEERLVAIPQLLHEEPATDIIILDDAFQHRPVKAGLNILLTEHGNLYTRDLLMPAGDLRDSRSSAKRADIIVVTKCPPALNISSKEAIVKELNPQSYQSVFFSKINYAQPTHLFTNEPYTLTAQTEVLLVCGIANPLPLQTHLNATTQGYDMLRFPDHHIFSIDDLEEIIKQFKKIDKAEKILLTTEKDGVRLKKFANELVNLPIFVISIEHELLFDDQPRFSELVINFVKSFNKDFRSVNGR